MTWGLQIKYDSLHNRTFLFAVFDPEGKGQASKAGAPNQDRRKSRNLCCSWAYRKTDFVF